MILFSDKQINIKLFYKLYENKIQNFNNSIKIKKKTSKIVYKYSLYKFLLLKHTRKHFVRKFRKNVKIIKHVDRKMLHRLF